MSSNPAKEGPVTTYPKSLSTIVVSVGGLALFLILASTLLVSQPIGSTVRSYFYAIDRTENLYSLNRVNESSNGDGIRNTDEISNNIDSKNVGSGDSMVHSQGDSVEGTATNKNRPLETESSKGNADFEQGVDKESSSGTTVLSGSKGLPSVIPEGRSINSSVSPDITKDLENTKTSSPVENLSSDTDGQESNKNVSTSGESGCDLYHGKWVHDSTGPLYSNNSCPVLTQMQNCQGNGRPDRDYENWRWKPDQCDLPRFDPKMFLELMRGKTLAFVGDSVARNQMESMLCILWQVEVPKNRGNKKMQRYYFRSTSTMIVRIWSSWLVHQTSDPFESAPAGVDKLLLDSPDEHFMEYIPSFDVIVLSSGHWFAKQSVYILNNEIVGGQLWWPDKSKPMKINNIEAFGISVDTVLTAMATHPNYTGLTILRSYSPDHYEGGTWNTGGSCTGKVQPAAQSELVENGFTNIMHEKQVSGFNKAMKKQTNKSKSVLMDITEAFSYRHDGHPGPYRSLDPNKITKRGPNGKPPPQDCLHWCMPGPVDTWNELVLEVIRREFQVEKNQLS